MKMRSIVVYVLVLLLCSTAARAQDQPNIWHSYAEKLSPGAFVDVRLSTGATVHGHLIQIDDDTITVLPKTQLPVPVRRLAFADVRSIETRREGVSPGAQVLIGVGSVAGGLLVVTIALLAGMR